MEYRPVVDIEYLLPLVQQDALIQHMVTVTPPDGLQVFYFRVMAGQVLLVGKRVNQHRRTHLGGLGPGILVRFGLFAVDRVVRVRPRLMQLLAQLGAEVVTSRRVPHQDGGCRVGALRQCIGGLVDNVLGNRCWLNEVDEVDGVAAQESPARESVVITRSATVYGELQFRALSQFLIRFVTMSAFPQRFWRPQGKHH